MTDIVWTVWYTNTPSSPSSSLTLPDILTDRTGKTHTTTVPAGQIHPPTWTSNLASSLSLFPPHYATLLSSTPTASVFVTKVTDALTSRAVFHDGRVILVGDALATFRPHFAVATEQAARHCLGLGRVWMGEQRLGEWEREVGAHARGVWIASRALGCFGCGRWWEFWGAVGGYLGFLVWGVVGRG
jgi:2-polyprenyl-6-methoxyphenol hydroxylase-like FAD-dependent oxidoreductase